MSRHGRQGQRKGMEGLFEIRNPKKDTRVELRVVGTFCWYICIHVRQLCK
jgi:hypothetical protein